MARTVLTSSDPKESHFLHLTSTYYIFTLGQALCRALGSKDESDMPSALRKLAVWRRIWQSSAVWEPLFHLNREGETSWGGSVCLVPARVLGTCQTTYRRLASPLSRPCGVAVILVLQRGKTKASEISLFAQGRTACVAEHTPRSVRSTLRFAHGTHSPREQCVTVSQSGFRVYIVRLCEKWVTSPKVSVWIEKLPSPIWQVDFRRKDGRGQWRSLFWRTLRPFLWIVPFALRTFHSSTSATLCFHADKEKVQQERVTRLLMS